MEQWHLVVVWSIVSLSSVPTAFTKYEEEAEEEEGYDLFRSKKISLLQMYTKSDHRNTADSEALHLNEWICIEMHTVPGSAIIGRNS